MIGKCFGDKEKEWRGKKSNLKEKVVKRVFKTFSVGKTECVWMCMCIHVITVGKI